MDSDKISPALPAQIPTPPIPSAQPKLSFDLPERLRSHDLDEGEDVTAPKTKRGRIMNQSFISMIASVGLTSNVNTTLGAVGENSAILETLQEKSQPPTSRDVLHKVSSENHIRGRGESIPRTSSERPMLQSMTEFRTPPRRRKHKPSLSDNMTTSQILPPFRQSASSPRSPSLPSPEPAVSPSTLEQAQDMQDNSQTDAAERSDVNQSQDIATTTETSDPPQQTLPERLASMFGFQDKEHITAELPCCLLQDAPINGYLYILQKHVCFYAYLPKEQTSTSKAGFLFKRGRQNPKYNKYYFALKGSVLYYYSNPNRQYFPRGTIELQPGLSTHIDEPSSDTGVTFFSVNSGSSTYNLKADSPSSAQDWVDRIRKAAFRAEHMAENIKISLPIENIVEIEQSRLTESADMIKIKVVENDETFVIDEYFFSVSEHGARAMEALRKSLEETSTTTVTEELDADGIPLEEISLEPKEQTQGAEGQTSSSNIIYASNPTITTSDLRRSNSTSVQSSKVSGINTSITSNFRPSLSILRPVDSFSSIQELYKAGTGRLKQATHIAGNLKSQSRRVGSLLARESKDYYERVYSMWAGKKTHYDDREGPLYEQATDPESERTGDSPGDRFRKHFALPSSEKLQATYYNYLHRVVPIYGKMYVGSTKLCFRSLMPGTRTKMILPFRDVENVAPEKGFRFGHYGLVFVIRGHEELFFEFRNSVGRDDCALTLLQILDSVKQLQDSRTLNQQEKLNMSAAKQEHELLQKARRGSLDNDISRISSEASGHESIADTVIFDDTFASIVDFKPTKPLRITCLTIGSRGDIQPYIALCKGLLAEGHKAVIATHAEFEPWIRSHGIEFRLVAGNPAQIMQLCVENDMFTVSFIREAQKFRGFIDELLLSSWVACQDAEILIESPSAMAGIHIAEALQIPYFRAFTMPWTRTRAYPHAFAVMNQKMGGNWNWYSYVLFEVGFWQGIAGQINSWRTKVLNLPLTSLKKMGAEKVPFLYNFSPSVVAPPLDFGHQIHITGYWFLDEGADYTPPDELLSFIEQARKDKKKLVYVGFGSVVVEDPAALTRAVSEAITDANVRCILCKGWSDRMDTKDASVPEIPLHDAIFQILGAPHDWLFRQVDAAVHHGGAGTTGASLRAGIPTVVKPFFGDQHFFAARVEDLGVGRCLKVINSRTLAKALIEATNSERIIMRAKVLGEQIRSENGVNTAIQNIYRDLEYARSLIKKVELGTNDEEATAESEDEGEEEDWTLVEDEDEEMYAAAALDGVGPEFQSTLLQMQRRSGLNKNSTTASRSRSARSSEPSGSENEQQA